MYTPPQTQTNIDIEKRLKKIEKSRYAILRELTAAALEAAVTTYMNDGWKPVGGLVVSYNEDLEHKEYIQPMSN